MSVVMCICQVFSALWTRIVHNAVDHLMAQCVTQPLQTTEAVNAVALHCTQSVAEQQTQARNRKFECYDQECTECGGHVTAQHMAQPV